jgi:hypothetical protein
MFAVGESIYGEELIICAAVAVCPMESPMAENNNKNPNEKQPGEKPEGTYHFNPGNQSGKSKAVPKDRPEPGNNVDATENHEKPSRE